MTDTPDRDKAAWIRRVLGIDVAGASGYAAAAWPRSNADASRGFQLAESEAGILAARGDDALAQTLLARASILRQEGGLRLAIAAWRAAQAVAVNSLTILEAAMRGSTTPERNAAIILVRGLLANLAGEPTDAEAVQSMTRYLKNDPLVSAVEGPNVFGITIALRKPLGDALDTLRQAMQAGKEIG